MRLGAIVMELSLLAAIGAIAYVCLAQPTRVREAPSVPTIDSSSLASANRPAPEVAGPARVWWREDDDKSAVPFVSDLPGGAALPGRWKQHYFCGEDSVPSMLFREPASPSPGAHESPDLYQFHWITATRDGVEWWCFTGPTSRPGASSAEEAKRFVGRWRHNDGKAEIVLELLDDGTGRGSDSSTWEWTAAERGLELRRQCGENAWVVDGYTLDEDLRGYRGRDATCLVGARLEAAPSGK